MTYDTTSRLWPRDDEAFFRDQSFRVVRQSGPHCVSTVLAILTGEAPETFQASVNTQDPVSWSEALLPYGMKLAYCPTDARKLKHFIEELMHLDDLRKKIARADGSYFAEIEIKLDSTRTVIVRFRMSGFVMG